jgi:hypothetical protein
MSKQRNMPVNQQHKATGLIKMPMHTSKIRDGANCSRSVRTADSRHVMSKDGLTDNT